MIWSKIKKAINSTLGTSGFKPLDKIITDSFSEVVRKQNQIKNNLESGKNDYEVKKSRESDFSTSSGYAANVPEWNVTNNVGAISPTVDMEELTKMGDVDLSTQISFPMINSGNLYLDFKTTLIKDIDSGVTSSVTGKVDIYLNEELVKTFGGTYAYADFNTVNGYGTIEAENRHLLSVNMGDVVTMVATLQTGGSVYDRHTLKVEGVQLKANIITAHTYRELGEKLENPTTN